MPIGIDLDDVLIDTLTRMNHWHNQTFGTNFRPEDYHTWKHGLIWGNTQEEAIAKYDLFSELGFSREILPCPGAQEGVRLLAEKEELIIITGRSNHLKEETEELVERYFPGIFSSINFAVNYIYKERQCTSKSKICQDFGVHTLIDDCPSYTEGCPEAGIKVLLFDYFWNQDFNPEGVERVYGWFGNQEKPGIIDKLIV